MTPGQRDDTCKKIIEKINELDVVAFCIMDYWTFDGFIALRDYMYRSTTLLKKRIFPGIELRMVAATPYRLNTHVLLNDDVSDDDLRTFVSSLKLAGQDHKPPTKAHMIEVGRQFDPGKLKKIYNLDVSARADEAKMLEIGYKSAEITCESIESAIRVVGEEHCLIIQPYDTSDGIEKLAWEQHPYRDSVLMKMAHCFETRNQSNVDLFLGHGHPKKPHVGPEFIENIGGYPKPVFAGSDAHRIADYGVYPSSRATWLKAQPTFKGLKHICHEPSLRCHIGDRPPKLVHIDENPTKYIRRIKLAKVADSSLKDKWFDGQDVLLNPGLVAIIGNKGSGKSALADILALAGNSHCTKMEFLNDRRFRHGGNKAKQFTATIEWADGNSYDVLLSQNPDLQKPERVRYLPQHFIEELCNEIAAGNETEFGKELRKVIFSRVPEEKQLKMGTLDDLLDYLIKARKKAIQQVLQTLHTLNETIVRNEAEMSDATLKSYRTSLELKEKELEAHQKIKPVEKQKPVEDPNDEKTKGTIAEIQRRETSLTAIRDQIETLKEDRTTLTAEETRLTQLLAHIENFAAYHEGFREEHQQEFEDAGFDTDEIVKVEIDRDPLTKRSLEVAARLVEIRLLLEGKLAERDTPAVNSLEIQEAESIAEIRKLQDQLNSPEKEYQTYLAQLKAWGIRRDAIVGAADKADTIEYLKDRINRATEVIPAELEALREERRELVRKIHEELLAIRTAYEELYAPVQKVASDAAESADPTDTHQLQFDAYLSPGKFQESFLDFIHKNRKGSFYGEDESRKAVIDLLNAHDLGTTDGVVAFTDVMYSALTVYERDGTPEKVSIESQLRQNKTVLELYDYLFGLGYLEVRYTLRLGGKDISQLSPGEKGALLLVFYLLLDTEEIPIIIDQPEHNLDNESVVRLLVDCIRKARARRQVMIVTHNPNLAVFCDADQIICCKIDKSDGSKITYSTGAIEDYEINQTSVNVLEGTYPAFDNRRKKYQKPEIDYTAPAMPAARLPLLGTVS
nr:AAA family ATPase [Paludisphaera borealis]